MPEISLRNPTGRNTRAHVVTIGEREFFFSYETCIAYRGPGPWTSGCCRAKLGGSSKCPQCGSQRPDHVVKLDRIRIANSWGPTTGRHFRELGCADFETVDDETFQRIVGGSL